MMKVQGADARELRRRLEEAWKSNDPAEAANDVAGVADDAINALSAALERMEALEEALRMAVREAEQPAMLQYWPGVLSRIRALLATPAPAGTKGGEDG